MAELKAWWKAVASGVAVGAVCASLLWIPTVRDLEQDVGLPWLFKLRRAAAGAYSARHQWPMRLAGRRQAPRGTPATGNARTQ